MSPDGKWIGQNKSSRINLFDAVTYEQAASFKDIPYISKEVFSSDSKYLLAKSTACKLALYDLDKMELAHKHKIKKNAQPQDLGICFSSDNKKIIDLVYNNDLLGYIAVWNIETWNETRYYEGENNVFQTVVSLKSNGKCFISGHRRDNSGVFCDPFFMWFDVHKGIGEFIDTNFAVGTKFIFAEKLDSMFAYHDYNATVTFLQEKRTVQLTENDIVKSIAMSADNTKTAILFGKQAVVYDFPSMEIVAELNVMIGIGGVGKISFSPDGRMVLIGTGSGYGGLYALD